MQITDLACEYRSNPLGIDILRPRFSWKLISSRRGARQRAYQVVAASNVESLLQGNAVLWDSGRVESDQSVLVPYAGPALQSSQRVYWRVRVWDENDQLSEWSAPAWLEMGLLEQKDWQASWIGNPLVGGPRTSVPCPYFRREFTLEEKVVSARLYITALGLYEASINGQRIGQDIFTPGWTDYHQRLQYQSYDVTEFLAQGSNVIGAVLGDGWYCGYVAWGARQLYGDRPRLLAQLEIRLTSGRIHTVVTDETWQTAVGPLLEADLIMGEAYDARLEFPGWNSPSTLTPTSLSPNPWFPALVFPHPSGLALVAQNTPTVRAQGELNPIAEPAQKKDWPDRKYIFDFGQNLVGRVRLKVKGKRGVTITLRFGEMLDENGRLYTENLRTALQTDHYTLKGDPEGEVYESRFTFHGFRYVEARGLPIKPGRDMLTAVILHSDNSPTLEFQCSDPLLNQLHHNILWGWKGNSVDIPTDCPQRDERVGWTGDAQVFSKTAAYLTHSVGFFSKWIQDLADAQLLDGAVPVLAPLPPTLDIPEYSAAWSDAFIIVPWTIWQHYGDTRLIETHYAAMCRYLDSQIANVPLRLDLSGEFEEGDEVPFEGFGDWLAQDGSRDRHGLTPRDLISAAFLAYDAGLMSQMAAAIGETEDAAKFNQLFEDTRAAFIQCYITAQGRIVGQTQTSYILSLYFDLLPEHLRPKITDLLIKDIQARQMHMSTGFVGTPYILQVLTDAGRVDLSYALLLQKTFPSWLYSVLHGATTIWERWDGWTEENGFHDPGMNSFNHYAYGAVGTWMFENITGIRPDSSFPGFKHIILQPRIGGGLTYARGEYQSQYGFIRSYWRVEDGLLIWEVSVPPNTTATAHIPVEDQARILEGGNSIEDSPGLKFIRCTEDSKVYELPPGSYRFETRLF